jgi:hypothetical protein
VSPGPAGDGITGENDGLKENHREYSYPLIVVEENILLFGYLYKAASICNQLK